MAEEFVGSGWAFPMGASSSGAMGLVSGDRELAEAIRLVIGTSPGERPMRPEFGCPLSDYLFAPADATTAGEMAWDVRASLERWEPRIDVLDVAVTVDDVEPNTMYIDLTYARKGANDPRNLVFPFYTIGEEA
ncbi:MAG: GPW/gp25 family protein [Acidimicrobiales bacterium]